MNMCTVHKPVHSIPYDLLPVLLSESIPRGVPESVRIPVGRQCLHRTGYIKIYINNG